MAQTRRQNKTAANIFLKLDSLPFCKGKRYLKLSKSLIGQFKKLKDNSFADNIRLTNSYIIKKEMTVCGVKLTFKVVS